MANRTELETAIEREVHKLVFRISEHTYDFVNLYVRRNNLPIDSAQMQEILKIVKIAMQDGELKQIDFFHQGIREALDETTETKEAPFTSAPATSARPAVEQKEDKITFSL